LEETIACPHPHLVTWEHEPYSSPDTTTLLGSPPARDFLCKIHRIQKVRNVALFFP
jgi:hypothetical protein